MNTHMKEVLRLILEYGVLDGKAVLQGKPFAHWVEISPAQALRNLADGTGQWPWRIKPDMVKINGFDVPAPVRKPLAKNTGYYCERPDIAAMYMDNNWDGDSWDEMWLARGIVHLTKENAVASCRARLGIDPYKV